ncbi:hypothetical protein [Embleya sp. MST-111070]|uniref:hypothetical protein n=1 Tax=Embleya sp. MST-111070 TaxID=3398231 RepID=UPI003F73EAA8
MGSKKDINKLLRALKKQDFRIERASNHHKVYKGKQLVVVLAATPSDHRGILNALAILKKAGFEP